MPRTGPRKRVLVPGRPYRKNSQAARPAPRRKTAAPRKPRAVKAQLTPSPTAPAVDDVQIALPPEEPHDVPNAVSAAGLREIALREARLPAGKTMIYVLAHPTSLEVRYVGQTIQPGRRLWLHQSASNNRRYKRGVCNWALQMIYAGTPPRMFEVTVADDGNAAEISAVTRYTEAGARLLNMNGGGQPMEQCHRAPTANTKGNRHSPYHARRHQLGLAPKVYRRMGRPDLAKKFEAKLREVDEAVARLAKRMGSREAARAYMDYMLAQLHPRLNKHETNQEEDAQAQQG